MVIRHHMLFYLEIQVLCVVLQFLVPLCAINKMNIPKVNSNHVKLYQTQYIRHISWKFHMSTWAIFRYMNSRTNSVKTAFLVIAPHLSQELASLVSRTEKMFHLVVDFASRYGRLENGMWGVIPLASSPDRWLISDCPWGSQPSEWSAIAANLC